MCYNELEDDIHKMSNVEKCGYFLQLAANKKKPPPKGVFPKSLNKLLIYIFFLFSSLRFIVFIIYFCWFFIS